MSANLNNKDILHVINTQRLSDIEVLSLLPKHHDQKPVSLNLDLLFKWLNSYLAKVKSSKLIFLTPVWHMRFFWLWITGINAVDKNVGKMNDDEYQLVTKNVVLARILAFRLSWYEEGYNWRYKRDYYIHILLLFLIDFRHEFNQFLGPYPSFVIMNHIYLDIFFCYDQCFLNNVTTECKVKFQQ